MDWYGLEMKFRRWMDKPMSTVTTIIMSAIAAFTFELMIFLSM